jgi:dUTPase
MSHDASRPIKLQMHAERGANPVGYLTEFAAGFTLCASERAMLERGKSLRIKTGVAIGLVKALGALIVCHRPMADLGVIPAAEMLSVDDRSPIAPLLTYLPQQPDAPDQMWILPGDRIAEVTIMPLFRAQLFHVDELPSAPGLRPHPDFS